MSAETLDYTALYAGPRAGAVKLLNRIERSDAYLDKLLDAELRSDDLVGPDKALLAELVHGVMRWQGRLDWLLNRFTHGNFGKSEINVKNALRVALYQILFLDHLPHYAAVNEAVEFTKRLRGEKLGNLVNAVLRNIIRNLANIHYPSPDEDLMQYLTVYYSHPAWMVKRWMQQFDRAELEKLLAANNEIPPITLRINRLRIVSSAFLAMLDEQQIAYHGSSFIDFFVKVKSLSKIAQMDAFRSGYFSIQDESAALPVLLLAPQPGERVIDLCAAPGGKTTFIGELMNNSGEIVAVDKYQHKLLQLNASCERLGLTLVKPLPADSAIVETEPAAKVLVDAPCSGLGVLRKKPDIRWKRQPEDIQRLAELQKKLLEHAAGLTQKGGVLVYSTCTIEPDENERIVRAFLEQHPEFSIDDPARFVNKSVTTSEGFVATIPHRHQLDGSFAVRLVRSSA